MASTGVAAEQVVSGRRLRSFHLTGSGLESLLSQGPLRPALLDQIELPRFEHSYPLYFERAEMPQPFFRQLQALVEAHSATFAHVREHLELLAGAFGEVIGAVECTAIAAVVDAALAEAGTRLGQLQVDPQAVEQELRALRDLLPKDGWLIPFGDSTVSQLSCTVLNAARQAEREGFAKELQQYAERLSELLAGDDSKAAAAASAGHFVASLGGRAASFLNASALAEALRHRSTPALPMEPERRVRCESALTTLKEAIHAGSPDSTTVLAESENEPGTDACEHAMTACRRQLEHQVTVWKALRIARLEVESAFDPAVHLDALETFDWTMARPSEIAALPVILVIQSARRIMEALTSFGRLLQSGLPVQVLITCEDGPAESPGCLAMAFPEAFSLQSSIACTDHLIEGLSEMARALRPAVAVLAVSSTWSAAALLPLSGSWPLYRYDPSRGESWYQRFSLKAEPASGAEGLTFAHVAALLPAWRNHFRMVPASAEPLEQATPFIAVIGEGGQPRQAVFTRELAGVGSQAQSRSRILAELAAPRAVQEVDAGAEGRARHEGATQAIERVITMLTNTGKG